MSHIIDIALVMDAIAGLKERKCLNKVCVCWKILNIGCVLFRATYRTQDGLQEGIVKKP